MFTQRQIRLNRRRRHQRPPLALAMICLLASTTALFATSREGEAQITAWVPAVKQTMDNAKVAMLGSDRKRGEISLNESGDR